MNDNIEKNAWVQMGYAAFAACIVLSSAMLTFAFFYQYLPVAVGVFGAYWGPLVGGAAGVIVFDAGAMAWLYIYLYGSENERQRVVAGQSTTIDIVGSAAASLAQLLLAGQLVTLSSSAIEVVGAVSIFVVAVTLVFNFISVWRFTRNANAAIIAQRNSEKRALIDGATQAAEREYNQKYAATLHAELMQRAERDAPKGAINMARDLGQRWRDAGAENQPKSPDTVQPQPKRQPPQPVALPVAIAAAHTTGGVRSRAPRYCLECGDPLPPGATQRKLYCDNACRNAYHGRKRNG